VQTAKHKIIYKPTVTVRVLIIAMPLLIKVITAIATATATVWYVLVRVGKQNKLGII
jgi:lipopolysaccharide/colanic/teichoic acid biosynthesis glycosyltransferase